MQALEGLKVLDLTKWLPGQYCTMFLGDFGSDIIKVEDLEGDATRSFIPLKEPGISYWHLMLNKNKRCITVNLRTKEGKKIVKNLALEADILVEGFKPGFMKKVGLDYKTLSKANPKLIFCSLTGFGQKGKFNRKPVHDLNVMGLAGMNALDEESKEVCVTDMQVTAIGSGMNGFSGILLALLARAKTGVGQQVDVSLFNTGVSQEIVSIASHIGSKETGTNKFARTSHYYNVVKCRDGRYLTVGAIEQKFWERMCDLIKHPELKNRRLDFAHTNELKAIIEKEFAKKDLQEWLDELGDDDICLTPVCTLDEAIASEVMTESMMLTTKETDLGEVHYVENPIRLSKTPAKNSKRAAKLGEDNEAVLQKMGYSKEEINRLKRDKII